MSINLIYYFEVEDVFKRRAKDFQRYRVFSPSRSERAFSPVTRNIQSRTENSDWNRFKFKHSISWQLWHLYPSPPVYPATFRERRQIWAPAEMPGGFPQAGGALSGSWSLVSDIEVVDQAGGKNKRGIKYRNGKCDQEKWETSSCLFNFASFPLTEVFLFVEHKQFPVSKPFALIKHHTGISGLLFWVLLVFSPAYWPVL